MTFCRYALVNTEQEELLSVLESHIAPDEIEEEQRQKQIRIAYLSDIEKEPESLQELLSLPRDACRVVVYEGSGLTFPRRPKYFAEYASAIIYTLEELADDATHSAAVELFETAPEENSADASFSTENLEVLGIA